MKLIPPKETTEIRMYVSDVEPGNSSRKNVYVSKGLKGRNIGKGIYRFRPVDKIPPKTRFIVQVQISEPWCHQKSWTPSSTCTEHGPACPCDEEDCVVKLVPVEVPRWMPVATLRDGSFDVRIYEHRSSKTVSHGPRPSDGAGFAACALVPVPRQEPCTS